MAKFKKMKAVYGDWTEWVAPIQGYRMACCDCGLVHNVEWQILKVTESNPDGVRFNADMLPWGDHRIAMRVSRNNRSTGQIRRHKKR